MKVMDESNCGGGQEKDKLSTLTSKTQQNKNRKQDKNKTKNKKASNSWQFNIFWFHVKNSAIHKFFA